MKLVQRAWTPEETAYLCDCVSMDVWTFAEIGRGLDRSRHSVTSQWRRVVKDMGWQGG